jgi:hypothetical protein
MSGPRGVYPPRPVAVEAGEGGVPRAIQGVAVDAIREDWLVEDRWWTEAPLRRRYFEAVLIDGRDVVVFCDLRAGRWACQPS